MLLRVLVIAISAVACGGPAPTPTPPPAVPLPLPVTDLEPGTYVNDFNPTVTFTIGDGWTATQKADGFRDIQDEPGSLHVVAIQFARAALVVPADTAESIADGIAAEDNIRVVERSQTTIDDTRVGTRLIVETTDPPDTDPPIFREVMTIPAGPLSIASGRRLQIDLFDVHMGVLAIMVGGSIAEWDRTVELSAPVLESVTIDDF